MEIATYNDERYEVSIPFTPMLPVGGYAEGIVIHVRSTWAKDAIEHVNKINKQWAEAENTLLQEGRYTFDPDKRVEYDIDLACSVITGFSGVVEDKEELIYNEENKRHLMTNYNWLREQVIKEAADHSQYKLSATAH